MTLELTWEWPDTLIIIGTAILIAVVAHIFIITLINRVTSRMRRLAAEEEDTLARRAASALRQASGTQPGRAVVHMTAVAHLIKSIWTVVLVIIVILTIMSTIGVPLNPILASAGIGGVILAFGAQSLVKDFLSGISMIIEDQYGVGDRIDIGDIVGTVEHISLRVTKIRDSSGTIWHVPNGRIHQVGNISQGYSTGIIDIPVAYEADMAQVTQVLQEVLDQVEQEPIVADKLLFPPELLGVETITSKAVTLRIRIKTPPNQQNAPAREIRERSIAALAAAGVPAPLAQGS
ncbi:MAG: mechanosensitive ion channel family protein [Propionibacteriaceae bacterium]|nr:mechanosensitive ion channel family protein [Propionibacteriaceae bacterium]